MSDIYYRLVKRFYAYMALRALRRKDYDAEGDWEMRLYLHELTRYKSILP